MNLGLRQVAALKQQIIMTPKLQQAIKVLLMPQLELNQFMTQQLEQNPLLEEDEIQTEELEIEDLVGTTELDPDTEWNEPEKSLDREDKEPDIDWDAAFDDMANVSEQNSYRQTSDEDGPQSDVAETQSLHEFLLAQLRVTPLSEIEKAIGEQIIGNLNDDGQLKMPLFTLSPKYQNDLDDAILSDEFRKDFERHLRRELSSDESSLSPNSTIRVGEDEGKWKIIDEENKHAYTARREDGRIEVFNLTFEEIAGAVGCDVEHVAEVLEYIQENFEPIGVAFRTVPESMLIQIKVNGIHNPIAEEILKNHFADFMNNQIPRIAQSLDVNIEEVIQAKELIGQLAPYPGRYFSDPTGKYLRNGDNPTRLIIPEVSIKKIGGEYHVLTNDDGMPRLRLNPVYMTLLHGQNGELDGGTKKWLEQQRSSAIDLISSINQRRRTIVSVTEAIFEIQEDFLEQGTAGLKPLTLKEIAAMAGVHESTVSRVTSNKYVETPQGIYKLKFFFSTDLPTDTGENVSSTAVKDNIKDMIDGENPAKPLSDQAIANALGNQGIHVARRTVQKYREELNILSSSKRKQVW
ncbi:MAG: RNA polymerase factor sigma-54 [Candidatus Poribacteria bacterium]|nr:RNA polymerase factor sigma-54 [Candidatus Poribacteria bacterium]